MIKNGITSILRTRRKSFLFFALIFVLSIFLGMGVSIWTINHHMIVQCEENYDTIGVFTYMGADYPDELNLAPDTVEKLIRPEQLITGAEEANESGANDQNQANGIEAKDRAVLSQTVLSFQPSRRCFGLVDGYEPKNLLSPYRDEAILIVKNVYETSVFQSENREFMSELTQAVYQGKKKHKQLVHFSLQDAEFEPDYNKQYVLCGAWFRDTLVVTQIDEVTDLSFLQDTDNAYVSLGKFYEGVNRLVSVRLQNEPQYEKAFHQRQAKLEAGDFYHAKNNDKVCLVTSDIARMLGLGVGDDLGLGLVPVETGNIYQSYDPKADYVKETYRIAGIIKTDNDYRHTVFIPQQEQISGTYGYEAGQVLLKNGSGDRFCDWIEEKLPDRMVVDVFDRGYTQVMDVLQSLQQTTVVLLVICGAAALAVLLLFGYLFVYKQRETVNIMYRLGTESRNIIVYLLAGSGPLVLLSSLLGVLAGFGVSGYFQGLVLQYLNAGIGTGIDSRYSDQAEQLVKDYRAGGGLPIWHFLVVALCLTVLAVLICLLFAVKSMPRRRMKMSAPKAKGQAAKSHAPRKEPKSSRMVGTAWQFSRLSVRRGGMRTWVVCLVSGALMLVLCVLADSNMRNEQERERMIEQTQIEGYFTNLNASRISSLKIDAEDLQQLEDFGTVENIRKTADRETFHYCFLGVPVHKDGSTEEVEPFALPDRGQQPFAFEKVVHEMQTWPSLLYTNDPSAVGEFFYGSRCRIDWMEGYDEGLFSEERFTEEYPCVISRSMQQEQGIELGDTIQVGLFVSYQCVTLQFRVVGAYHDEGSKAHILIPYAVLDQTWMTSDGGFMLDTIRFTLKNAGQLTKLKDDLEQAGFAQLGARKERGVVVLKDVQYQKTLKQMEEKIKYNNLLYPALYVLTGLISILVSYLMMHNRKGELALMQSMGTGRGRIFASFFLEQAMLSAAGIGGVWLLWGVLCGFYRQQAMCLAVCLGCYLFGCALSVAMLNRNNVRMLLGEGEER